MEYGILQDNGKNGVETSVSIQGTVVTGKQDKILGEYDLISKYTLTVVGSELYNLIKVDLSDAEVDNLIKLLKIYSEDIELDSQWNKITHKFHENMDTILERQNLVLEFSKLHQLNIYERVARKQEIIDKCISLQ